MKRYGQNMDVELKGQIDPGFEEVGEAFLKNFSKRKELGAASTLYLNQKKVVDIWAGYMDESGKKEEKEIGRDWEEDTLVNVWSTTKGFVSLAIHMLRSRGQLDIDLPVAHYWPEFAAAGKAEIPVRWLLNHRSGMGAWKKESPAEMLYDWDEAVSLLAQQEPLWEPNTASGYHLLSYGHLVGEVLRRIDGRTIDQFIREEITEPLELDFHMPLGENNFDRVTDVRLMPNFSMLSTASRAKLMGLAKFAFTNPLVRVTDANSTDWRKSVVPAANGHATARAIAGLYGVLATGGTSESKGHTLLNPADIEGMREPAKPGVDLILGAGMANTDLIWGLGYRIDHEKNYGPNPKAFYHGGFGGSLGFCDPENGIGFGYVMNRMDLSSRSGQRAGSILKAIYKCLSVIA